MFHKDPNTYICFYLSTVPEVHRRVVSCRAKFAARWVGAPTCRSCWPLDTACNSCECTHTHTHTNATHDLRAPTHQSQLNRKKRSKVTRSWITLSSLAMSLWWRRAGRSRAASRVCCTTPSMSQRAAWRYVPLTPSAPRGAPYCCRLNAFWPPLCCHQMLSEWSWLHGNQSFSSDLSWGGPSVLACRWCSTASVWPGW